MKRFKRRKTDDYVINVHTDRTCARCKYTIYMFQPMLVRLGRTLHTTCFWNQKYIATLPRRVEIG
jgi:hypothetical protein